MPWMVDAANGDGRTGLDGFDSELNVLIKDRASGIGAAFALVANAVAPALVLWRRIIWYYLAREETGGQSCLEVDGRVPMTR